MALPRVSVDLPIYDPTKSSLAYGDRALPKLNRELQSSDLRVRQQALLLLADVLHRRENVASALREGIAHSLKELLADEDGLVRERAAKVLCNIAQHSLGRQAFLQEDIITALSKLFSDALFEVRVNAHSAVEMCARNTEGARGTVVAGLVPLCVEKLVKEDTSKLKEIILETLHWCFIVDTTDGLACDVITICQDLLEHTQPNIRGQAARLVYDLSVPLEGKEAACAVEGCIPKLIKLLDGHLVFMRAQALAALMSIAVITDGKHAILTPEVLERLKELLEDESSEVRLNTIKLLSLLAETPQGKESMKSAMQKLQEMSVQDESDMVKKTAYTATRIIQWLP